MKSDISDQVLVYTQIWIWKAIN